MRRLWSLLAVSVAHGLPRWRSRAFQRVERRRFNENFHDCLVNTSDYTATVFSGRKRGQRSRIAERIVEP